MSGIPIFRRRWLLLSVVAILTGLGTLLALAVDHMREAAERAQCNLGGIALAFHNYQAANGTLPPAILYGKDGRPLHSWRVLLLPFIEEDALYKEFRLDEPWDSEHNMALLPRMPKTYAPPVRKAAMIPPYHTILHVFVGRGTPFEERRENTRREGTIGGSGLKIPDGKPNTFLFVEAGKPVPWTKPEELPYDPDRSLPELPCVFRKGFTACTVDGSYRFIPKGTPEATLRASFTRNGGEDVDLYRLP